MLNSKTIFKYTIWTMFIATSFFVFPHFYLIFTSINWGTNFNLYSLLSFVDLLIPQVPKAQTTTTAISHLSFFYVLLVLWIYSLLAILNNYFQ